MAKVFSVELSDGANRFAELTLPATDYELLYALEKLQMQPDDSPQWEIFEHTNFQYLEVYVNNCSLYELNSLSRKLGSMNPAECGAFEGLLKMALDKREGPMSMADLFTYANSTSCCHILNEVGNDDQLGKFYVENGFIPELENVPDYAFDRLDYNRIGKEMREAEHGVHTKFGYVVQHSPLKPESGDMNTPPKAPHYTLRLLVSRYPFETNDAPEVTTHLNLPTNAFCLTTAFREIGATSLEEVVYQIEDSAIPGFPEDLGDAGILKLNLFANTMKKAQSAGTLTKLKAVLHTQPIITVSEAIQIGEQLDSFSFEPQTLSPEDVARDEIKASVPDNSMDTLLKHIDLSGYGLDLIKEYGSQLTPYGLITPTEGQSLEAAEQTCPQLSM